MSECTSTRPLSERLEQEEEGEEEEEEGEGEAEEEEEGRKEGRKEARKEGRKAEGRADKQTKAGWKKIRINETKKAMNEGRNGEEEAREEGTQQRNSEDTIDKLQNYSNKEVHAHSMVHVSKAFVASAFL